MNESQQQVAIAEDKALTMGMDKQIVVTPEQMITIKAAIFPEATDDELKLFIYHCQRKGTHPMDKLIHPIKRGGKVAFQASIDFLRAESESAGDYRGMKQPVFDFDENGKLDSATVTVIRELNGLDVEFTATAYWNEFYPGEKLGFMWDKMPRHMLSKCAEALARRQAWPKKLADLYTPEEMAQSESQTTAKGNQTAARSASVKPAAKPAQSPRQQEAVDAEFSEAGDIPLADKIDMALDFLTGGEEGPKKNLLMEASRNGKTSGAFLTYAKLHLPETSQQWLANIYAYLEPMVQERAGANGREPGEEG